MKGRQRLLAAVLAILTLLLSSSAMAQDGTEDDRSCGYVGPAYVCWPPL